MTDLSGRLTRWLEQGTMSAKRCAADWRRSISVVPESAIAKLVGLYVIVFKRFAVVVIVLLKLALLVLGDVQYVDGGIASNARCLL